MTTNIERYRALKQSKKLLEELMDPGKTPRVPGAVRDRARSILKHFPTEHELEIMATACPDMLDSEYYSLYNKNLYKGL